MMPCSYFFIKRFNEILDTDEEMSYYVYVIELDKEVLKSKKFRKQNPRLNPKKSMFLCWSISS